MKLGQALRNNRATGRATRVKPNDMVIFEGGLNLVSAPLLTKPGELLGCKNYEPGVRGGYDRTDGYERFDSRPSPTRANYWGLVVEGVSGTPFNIGDRLRQYDVGEASPDSTTLIADGIIFYKLDQGGGTWVIGVAQTEDTPDFANGFQDDGDVYVSPVGTGYPGTMVGVSSFASRNGAPTDEINMEIEADKVEFYRDEIEAVGAGLCEGKVLGVAVFRTMVVAWRNAIGGASALMFKTTTDTFTGWEQVDLGFKIRFDTGSVEIEEGDTIEGGTSGATAVARRIVSDDGTWAGDDASGYIIVHSITGTFSAGEDLEVGGNKVAEFVSSAAQTLLPDGKYRTRVHNFAGAGDRKFLYGVDGENRAFEYDGETFTQIETGMEDDRPTHLFELNNHLGLCFRGGSIQNSGYQRPLNWNPIVGADERSIGGDVTDLVEEVNRTVFIATRDRTYVYYGDVVENFQLRLFNKDTGMIGGTCSKIGQTIYMDDHGFTTLKSTQAFGNFSTNSISDNILPLFQGLVRTRDIAGSVIVRRKNLYRCFFDDGTGLVISSRAGNKLSGWTTVNYGVRPSCFDSGEAESPFGIIPGQTENPGPINPERVFMGAEDGFVYETDIGTSFDGGNIEHFLRMSYHHAGSPEVMKHWRKGTIDVEIRGLTTLFATVDFNYGNRSGQAGVEVQFQGGGGFWDIATWDEFKWSGQVFDQVSLKIEGDGYNIGLFFYGNSSREVAHTLYNITYHHSQRRINRGSQAG